MINLPMFSNQFFLQVSFCQHKLLFTDKVCESGDVTPEKIRSIVMGPLKYIAYRTDKPSLTRILKIMEILWHFIGSRLDFEYPYIFTILYIFTMENIWQIHVFCPRLARARVGPQDKQVITHYGPPTLLAVAPMTRRFT